MSRSIFSSLFLSFFPWKLGSSFQIAFPAYHCLVARLLVNLRVSLFYFTAVLQEFILEDIRPRYELLMSWLYQEYGASEGTGMPGEDSDLRQSYSDCILHLMDGLYVQLDPKDK